MFLFLKAALAASAEGSFSGGDQFSDAVSVPSRTTPHTVYAAVPTHCLVHHPFNSVCVALYGLNTVNGLLLVLNGVSICSATVSLQVKMIREDNSVLVPYGLETDGMDIGTDEDVALLAELYMIHQTMEQVCVSYIGALKSNDIHESFCGS